MAYDELTARLIRENESLKRDALSGEGEWVGHKTLAALRKDAERYRWLRDLLAVEDVARLVDEHAQWDWCQTDPAESARTDASVDKAIAARRAVGAA
jgi:hypothetical protein